MLIIHVYVFTFLNILHNPCVPICYLCYAAQTTNNGDIKYFIEVFIKTTLVFST